MTPETETPPGAGPGPEPTPAFAGQAHEATPDVPPRAAGIAGLWTRALRIPKRYTVAFVVYLVAAAVLMHDWDGFVFRTVVHQLWQGVSPYEVAITRPYYTFLGISDTDPQWWAYPPLPLLLMALTSLPAVLFELAPVLERVLWKLPIIIGGLALAAVGEAWARRIGASPQGVRLTGMFLLFQPFFILAGPAWGMTDGLLMAFLLGGLLRYEEDHPVQAGLLVSAAVLVKPFAALLLIALLPVLLARHGWRPLLPFSLSGIGLGALIILPFLIHTPQGFWIQVVGNHLARDVQGYTLWALWPMSTVSLHVVSALSMILIALGLLAVAVASRTRTLNPTTPLFVLVAAAATVLFWNRVVNEQYFFMIAAPLAILLGSGHLGQTGRRLTHWMFGLFAAAVLITGFHFLTFVPPDIAMPLFGRPVDAVAHDVRHAAPLLWHGLHVAFSLLIPLTLAALGLLAMRRIAGPLRLPRSLGGIHERTRTYTHTYPTAFACFVLVLLAMPGFLGPAQHEEEPFVPAYDETGVAAFYYIWWHNPSHDPDILYGNWFPVSQHPQMGYYTNDRGVHRDHAQMMVDNGIDTAIVSYHQGNLERYTTFQEEATKVGLRVAPLIELNQVYDQPKHRPIDEAGTLVPYAAYRLDPGTRDAIVDFVMDLEDLLHEDAALRIDDRPVVYFYDSYVSAVSFHDEDQHALAEVLLDLYSLEELRAHFNDTDLQAEPEDIVRHHPPYYSSFFDPGVPAAIWREAHLEQHARFWIEVREELEERLGPLFLISGEAYNERAGFEAGTIKSLINTDLFDGSFLYSPSFPWGNEPDAEFPVNFARWEDRNHWLTALSDAQGHYTSTGVAPAYDDTVNRPHGFVIPDEYDGQDFYDLSWMSLIRHPTDEAAIATFNEWFEGSSIEPSIEFGDRHLLATSDWREAFLTAERPEATIMHIIHERSSRTHPDYDELDNSHAWGLRMITAAMRADDEYRHLALDARAETHTVDQTPGLILAEGGRPPFILSPFLHTQIDGWLDDGAPMVLFGPDAAGDLRNKLPADCDPADRVDDPFLRPGDAIYADEGQVWLERDGERLHVGTRCGAFAHVVVKPWDTQMTLAMVEHPLDPYMGADKEAECLGTILQALAPAHAPRDAQSTCALD